MKSADVSYTANETCKTLSVPFIADPFRFGTGMTDPVWSRAAAASDFVLYPHGGIPQGKTKMMFFRNESHLLIGFFFTETEEDRTHLPPDASSVWQGDLAELHFGGLEPDPWLLQLAVGIDGNRFDSTGSLDRWEAVLFSRPDGWGAEIRIDLNMLHLTEGGFRFDLMRESMKRKERIIWSRVYRQYHEVPNFGELLFGSYGDIASIRTGKPFLKDMTREEFESARTGWEIPANQVVHGPFVSCPDGDSVCISWQTAGKVAAWPVFREKGSDAPFVRAAECGCPQGVMPCEAMHFFRLTGLKPDTEYEYELLSLFPVTCREVKHETLHTFRTLPGKGKPFSFFAVTDLHSDAEFLRQALRLPEAEQASFQISLGDNLSCSSGPDGLFSGVIDPIAETHRRYGQDKPLVFVRGNHEELGIYAAEYFRVMHHPSGRSWYTFTSGSVFFIVLDSGDDSADSPDRPMFDNTLMFGQEHRFLEEVTASEAYRCAAYRIVLMHIPPLPARQLQRRLTEPLVQAEVLPDLMICGHEHKHIWLEAGDPDGLVFPVLVSSNRDVLSCDVATNRLELKILSPKSDGKAEHRKTITIARKW